MKILMLALALVAMSSIPSMAAPSENPYLCYVIDGQLPNGDVCR
jgi:hypothetical protein